MLKQKERELLLHLIESQDKFVTSQSLASELSLSDRTVRTYIQQLKDLVETNGGQILAKQGYGYCLKIKHKVAFDSFLNQQEITLFFEDEQPTITEIADRQNYILNKLLLEDATLFMDDLSENLYISRSSLSKDIQEIKEKLKPYSLVIVSKSGKGLWVEGEERNKRHFIMDTFFGKNYTNLLKELYIHRFFKDISFEELIIIILDETREAQLKISDIIIQNLVLHLSLGIKRLREGFGIKDLGVSSDISNKIEYQVAGRIVKRIEMVTDVQFPKEEISYLALHLMAKSNNPEEDNLELKEELAKCLIRLSRATGYPISEDYQLHNGLLEHLKPMLVRLDRGIILENPLTNEIKKDYSEAFNLTKNYLGKISVLQNFIITDGEWAYLALHLMAALEKARDFRKVHVLIICATGYGSAQLLKNRVINEFGKHIVVANVQGYYEINEASLKDINLIISSIDLSSMVFQVPVLHVSVFLNDTDVQKIRKVIGSFNPGNKQFSSEPQILTEYRKKELFSEQMKIEYFHLYRERPTKEQVLNDLTRALSQGERESYEKEILEQVKHREKMGQIVFSDSIVVPHPAVPVGISTKIAVALIPDGMIWDYAEKICFVFLISPSYIENEDITVATKAIVQLVERLDIQEKILSQPNFENFSQIFIKLM